LHYLAQFIHPTTLVPIFKKYSQDTTLIQPTLDPPLDTPYKAIILPIYSLYTLKSLIFFVSVFGHGYFRNKKYIKLSYISNPSFFIMPLYTYYFDAYVLPSHFKN